MKISCRNLILFTLFSKKAAFLFSNSKEHFLFEMILSLAQFRAMTQASKYPIIGLDMGTRKTGVAFSDATRSMAWPLATIKCDLNDTSLFIDKLKSELERKKLNGIAGWVVGAPLAGQSCKKTVHECRVRTAVQCLIDADSKTFRNVCFIDERYTTGAALRVAHGAIGRLDAMAACEILLRYIESSSNGHIP
jgi:RNase H-fold protein (predicted Holliday junction resolvase)